MRKKYNKAMSYLIALANHEQIIWEENPKYEPYLCGKGDGKVNDHRRN